MIELCGLSEDRIIGHYTKNRPGKTIIATGSLHGNEPAGVKALQEVFQILENNQPDICGEIIGIVGHLEAFIRGVRYVDYDLNRLWSVEQVEKVRSSKKEDLRLSEEREQHELLTIFDHLISNREEVLLLDLHTTSATGGIFTIANSHSKSIEAARTIHVPVITGLAEVLEGTTMHFFDAIGLPGIGFEGGQHYEESSVENIVGAVAFLLEGWGCLDAELTIFDYYKGHLLTYGKDLPEIVKFKHRQAITEEDQFIMKPGFKNFQRIHKGEFLAIQNGKEVYAPHEGLILMPLYQKQGNDGFFIVEKVA